MSLFTLGPSPKTFLEGNLEVAGTKVHEAVWGVDPEAGNRDQADSGADHAEGNGDDRAGPEAGRTEGSGGNAGETVPEAGCAEGSCSDDLVQGLPSTEIPRRR